MLIQTGSPGRQPLDALPHFVGGLVGEGQGQDLPGRHAVVQKLGDAMRDDPGFSAARTGQDQQRALAMFDRFALGRSQRIEQMTVQA